ncbi:M28 family peptidase, partial [candidate division KSB1 bacterium]
GAVDCGSGFTPGMEAARLIMKAGGRPKRSIMVHLFAAEENGIIGAQSWVRKNPDKVPNIAALMNRDHNPSAINSVTVPTTWEADFGKITAPIHGLNPRFPFELIVNRYPSAPSTRPGGTDASAFSMVRVPTLRMGELTDYEYSRAWHTLYDTYNEVVPYTEHQEHSALVMAILAYGIANLDHLLTRDGVYLEEGMYVDIDTDKGRFIVSLDYENAPETVASFVTLFEAPGGQGGGRARRGRRSEGPAIGVINNIDSRTAARAEITLEANRDRAVDRLPRESNPGLNHRQAGVLGMISPTQFYITSGSKPDYDGRYTPIGTVLVGQDIVNSLAENDEIRGVSITRVGEKAMQFNRQQ